MIPIYLIAIYLIILIVRNSIKNLEQITLEVFIWIKEFIIV